jgi:hypothetical protein
MAKLTIAMRNSTKRPKNTTSGHQTHFPLGLFINAAKRGNQTCKYRDHFMISAFRREIDEIISLQTAFGWVRRDGGEHGSFCALPLFCLWIGDKTNNKKMDEK